MPDAAWQFTPYSLPLMLTVGVSFPMALYAWRGQRAVYALSLGGVCLAVCLWALISALQINSEHWALSATLVYTALRCCPSCGCSSRCKALDVDTG